MFKKIIPIIIIASSLTILGCGKPIDVVQMSDKVNLTYSASFEDGSIFKNQESIEIIVGSGNIVKGIEDGIIGLKQGEEKQITITPDNGYGKDYDNSKIQNLTKMIFDRMGIKPEIGKTYKIGNLEGVVKGTQGNGDFQIFMLDTNPKNTYENLIFKVKIDKIN